MQKKILIIEDDRVLAEAIKIELEEKGFSVCSHYEGNSALEKIFQEMPDLIVLDLVLPGIHGFEILEKIKKDEKTKNIPVIVATNLGEESDRKRSFQLGADEYFVKALNDLEDLSNTVTKKLAK